MMETAKAQYGLEESLGYWVSRVAAAMEVSFERELMPLGVTAKQWRILITAYRGQARAPAEFARALGIQGAAVTRLLDRLEDKNLLKRQAHVSDRRSLDIELTDVGRALVRDLIPLAYEFNERFWKVIPKNKRRSFLRLLQALLQQTHQPNPGAPGPGDPSRVTTLTIPGGLNEECR